MNASHPSDEVLVDFVHGRLRHRLAEPIEVHLKTCGVCAARLVELESTISSDSLTEQIRKAVLPVDVPTPLPGRNDWPDKLKNHPRFRILSLLSRGTDESIYLAEDRTRPQRLALKLVIGDSLALLRIADLIRLLAIQKLPRIDPPIAVEPLGEQLLIAEDYRSGATLREVVCSRGRLTLPEVVPYAQQIAEALAAAHALGLSHGDLQLKDCFLTESGIALRGWARRRICETVPYDPRADATALGRCLLGLLTGHTLLDSRGPLPFGELWADVPTAVTEVIRSITRAEFATPEEAVDALVQSVSTKRWWQRWTFLHS